MAICFADYLNQQRQEALGCDNKWYCSQYYGYDVQDPETLLKYYIKHGGASHFHCQHRDELVAANAPQSRSS